MPEEKAMSKEKAEALYAEIKDNIVVTFQRYYKFSFSFGGETAEASLYLSLGGVSDDIYRLEVDNGQIELLDNLAELSRYYNFIILRNKADNSVYELSHY